MRKPRGTLNLKGMTQDERRAYNRESQQRHRENKKKLFPPKGRDKLEKPETWACSKCGAIKPLNEKYFRPDGQHVWGIKKTCYVCESLQIKALAIKRKYGVTLEEYEDLKARGCAICGRSVKRMAFDHCHNTGRPRDMLCSNCNHGLGNFEDDPERLRSAAKYVELHRMFS